MGLTDNLIGGNSLVAGPMGRYSIVHGVFELNMNERRSTVHCKSEWVNSSTGPDLAYIFRQ